jgi:hypothetical protein
MNGGESSSNTGEKKPISFGFSKFKPKTTLAKPEVSLFKADPVVNDDKPELILSIDKNKILTNKPVVEVKPLVIPCARNRDIIGNHQKKKDSAPENATATSELTGKAEDVAAVKALIEQAKNSKSEGKDEGLVIEAAGTVVTAQELEKVEDPNYEAMDLEKFG